MQNKMIGIFVVVAVAFGLVMSAAAFAEDQSSGCGLGWQVSQKDSLLSSAVRSTTNGILPNTFSMTFGTSGCAKHSIVKNEKQQQYFVESNMDAISQEMAQGDGEYLRSFAAVMGCGDDYSGFARHFQAHYSDVFGQDSVTPSQVLQQVKAGILSDSELNRACVSATI